MISNPTIRHDVVTFEFKKSEIIPPQCSVHQEQSCDIFSQECESPICLKCLASGSHENHPIPQISEIYISNQELIRKDLNELENIIAPTYESILSEIEEMSSNVVQKHGERQQTIQESGKKCHRIVENVIQNYMNNSQRMERVDNNSIQSLKLEFQEQHSLIQKAIIEIKSILDSNDSSKLVNYTSKNEQYRNVPCRFELRVPQFKPMELSEHVLYQIIGDIPETEKLFLGQDLKDSKSVTSSEKPVREFLDMPIVMGNVNIDTIAYKVSCIPNTDQFYVSDDSKGIKRMNTEGKVLEEVDTKTELGPDDLTVTREGHLVYADGIHGSINIVRNSKVECLFRLQNWIPTAICSTLTGDILVHVMSLFIMPRPAHRRILRYSGYTVKQEIQLRDISIDSFQSYRAFIDENKNLDIVVSESNSVLVLNNEGQSMFTYYGNPQSNKSKTFLPRAVTTDSMCHILIADIANNIIHIIDQNGQFIRYIDNCKLNDLFDFGADKNDILFVADSRFKEVKQIKYIE